MVKKDKEQQYLSIKAMFESNNVKKMRDIEKLYPTMMATDMGMNHGRYIKKLYNPEEFTIKQICKLASLIRVAPNIVTNVIFAELANKMKKVTKEFYLHFEFVNSTTNTYLDSVLSRVSMK